MAYTGDTGPGAALADLARDAGLLLAEATLAAPGTSDWGQPWSPLTRSSKVRSEAGDPRVGMPRPGRSLA